jgi:hypothetical protein
MLSPGPKRWRNAVDGLIARYLREDPWLARCVLLYALTQLATIGWDLPCMYGWENDGIAPRDLFGGLAFNLLPGHAHRYPFLQYALLALLVWPVVLAAALTSRSFRLTDLTQRVLSVPALTAIALIAKLLSVAMSCVLLCALARIARRTLGREAGRWAFGFAALSLSLAYYGRVSNLDGPYLMWIALSLDRLLDVFERGEPRDYRGLAICAAAALATKDQAYGVYALTLPIYLGVLLWLHRRHQLPSAQAPDARRIACATLIGTLGYGVFSAALLNPTGFVQRLRLLTGENSQDWRRYGQSAAGLYANLRDIASAQAEFFWPWPVVLLAWAGVIVAITQASRPGLQRTSLRLVPLTCALSSLASFALLVGRAEHRFVLPLGFALSYYAGAAAAMLAQRFTHWGKSIGCVLLLLAAGHSLALHLSQWGDARREVEAKLAALPAGSRVETYGLGVYLPRFDRTLAAPYSVQRVGPHWPVTARPAIPGVLEVEAAYGGVTQRAPDVLVIPEAFATRFLPIAERAGQITSAETRAAQRDSDAQAFFSAALQDRLPGYRVWLVAEAHLPRWAALLGLAPVHIHGSTAAKTWLLSKTSR